MNISKSPPHIIRYSKPLNEITVDSDVSAISHIYDAGRGPKIHRNGKRLMFAPTNEQYRSV